MSKNTHKAISKSNIDTLVFSGGGAKGFAYIGVIRALEEYNILHKVINFAGTSIGGLMALLLALEYTYSEVAVLIERFDCNLFKDINLPNFLDNYGLDSGEKVNLFLKYIIFEKLGSETANFEDLHAKCGNYLTVVATRLKTREVSYFSLSNSPQMPLYLAVRMSMNLPGLFGLVNYKGISYVDGALKDNFPIAFFDPDRTLGFYLGNELESDGQTVFTDCNDDTCTVNDKDTEIQEREDNDISGWFEYIKSIWETVYDDLNKFRKSQYWNKYCIITLNITHIDIFKINMTRREIKQLYRKGYLTTVKKFKDMNYKKYTSDSGISRALDKLEKIVTDKQKPDEKTEKPRIK